MGTYCVVPLEPILIARRDNGVGSCLFVPIYPRIPSVPTGHFENQDWRYLHGSHVRTIQERSDKDTGVVKIIDNDTDVRSTVRPFSFQALSCLPPFPWSISSRDLSNPIRQDFRHLCIFSVDPPGCKNIDDALHCRALSNGNFEVGVHIADVTNFVQSGTVLDNEVAQRATSLAFERRIDILPKVLSEEICSLRAGMEKLAFSVIWEMTPKAQIIYTRYTKSVIKNRAALCYVEAQERMEDCGLVDAVTTNLRNLNTLAKIMRQKRIDRGALITLTSGSHDPFDKGWEAKQMVEEFMLAANVSVAEKILKHFPMCSLLRRQPSPTKERLEPLLRTANSVGVSLDVTSSKAMAESLDCAVSDDPSTNNLIRTVAMRCMNQAVYSCSGDLKPSEYSHYSLAVPVYTHFTSPNRRYADIIVHRLLEASLGIISFADILQNQHRITTLANSLNQRHWNAQLVKHATLC